MDLQTCFPTPYKQQQPRQKLPWLFVVLFYPRSSSGRFVLTVLQLVLFAAYIHLSLCESLESFEVAGGCLLGHCGASLKQLLVHLLLLLVVEIVEEHRNDSERGGHKRDNGEHRKQAELRAVGLCGASCVGGQVVADKLLDEQRDIAADDARKLLGKTLGDARHALCAVAVLPFAVVHCLVVHLGRNDLTHAVENHKQRLPQGEGDRHGNDLLIKSVLLAADTADKEYGD